MFFSLPLYVIIYVIYKTCFMLFLKRGEKFMKRKIMIAAVAAAVIFAVIAILSVLAQTPALI